MNAITQFPDRHLRGGNAETLCCTAEPIEVSLPASHSRSRDPRCSPLDAGLPIRHKANQRPPDVGAALLVTPSTSSRARTVPRPTVEAGRPCAAPTETELARGERFMVSGPMRLEALKQTDGHRISALRWTSCGIRRSGLVLEGVLHLLASIFQTGLRLVQLPLVLGAVVTGEPAGGFFCR